MTRTQVLIAASTAFDFAAPASAQFVTPPVSSQGVAVGNSKAVLLTPFTLLKEENLNFGSYVLPIGQSGSVTLDPVSGGISPTVVIPIPSSAPQRGKMDFAGTPNAPVTVQVTSFSGFLCAAQAGCSGGLPTSLTLDGVERTLQPGVYDYTLPSDGVLSFYIGGTVDIPASTADGTYGETFDVTLTYQ